MLNNDISSQNKIIQEEIEKLKLKKTKENNPSNIRNENKWQLNSEIQKLQEENNSLKKYN